MFIESSQKFPQGSNFLNVVTSKSFLVDKSSFIKEVLDSKDRGILITRPSGWGKSLNLSMLNYFYRIEFDQDKKPMGQSRNKALFEGGEYQMIGNSQCRPNKIELNRLNIAKDELWLTKYSSHLGRYPVIYMDWSTIRTETFEQFLIQIKRIIAKVFVDFPEISTDLLTNCLSQINGRQYTMFDQNSNEGNVRFSLHILIQLLNRIYDRNVVVLIDGYDSQLNYLLLLQLRGVSYLERKQRKQQRRKIEGFISSMFCYLFQKKRKLEKVVITGVFDALDKSKEFCFDFHCQTYGISDIQFSSSFGFGWYEIQQLIDNAFYKKAGEQRNLMGRNICEWLCGFINPETLQKQILNPCQVISYLNRCYDIGEVVQFEPFQRGTVLDEIIKVVLSDNKNFFEKLIQLNEKTPTTLRIYHRQNFESISQRQEWSYLLFNCGYLTGRKQDDRFDVLLPNRQVTQKFRNLEKIWIQKREFDNWKKSIDITNSKDLKIKMQQCFKEARSGLGKVSKSLLSYVFLSRYLESEGKETHKIYAQTQSGFGKIDTLFNPKEGCSDTIILHEYKIIKDRSKDSSNLLNALWSVYENNYLQKVLEIAGKCAWIKQLIIRPIIIFVPNTSQDIQLQVEDIIHPIQDAFKISEFFNKQKNRQILNVNDVKRQGYREALLKEYKIRGDIKQLLKCISTILYKQKIKQEFINLQSSEVHQIMKMLTNIKEWYINQNQKQIYQEKNQEQVEIKKYEILIALILSIKTDKKVLEKSMENLKKNGLHPQIIAQMSQTDLIEKIKHCIFAELKSSKIIQLSKMLKERNLPRNASDFEEFSFIGEGTRISYLRKAQKYVPEIKVDKQIHRVAKRILDKKLVSYQSTKQIIEAIVPSQKWCDIDDALEYLGKNICTDKKPKCSQCPVNNLCPSAYKVREIDF